MVITDWDNLFVAATGAAAALAGLIIVAMSVNVQDIISNSVLTSRARATIASLVLIVVVSVGCLIPGQPIAVIGAEVLVFSIGALIPSLDAARLVMRVRTHSILPQALVKVALSIVPIVLFLVGGILLALAIPGAFIGSPQERYLCSSAQY